MGGEADDDDYLTVTGFWRKAGPDAWFTRNDAFDMHFRETMGEQHFAAARRERDHWLEHAEGSFALMIVLDQYPRNCFRGTGHMYATDPLARSFARLAIAAGHDLEIEEGLRMFFYLPFSHSEDLADHEFAIEKTMPLGEEMLKHTRRHRDIIRSFGRFPHRNPILGRDTTPEEQAFLDGGGFRG
jgi:uncharacterized protein (DUF924 family)